MRRHGFAADGNVSMEAGVRAIRMVRTVLAPIGLGLAALGRPAYITDHRELDLGRDRDRDRTVAIMRARTHAMLDAAWARGIRFIDAARSSTVSPRSSSGRGSPSTPSAASSSRSSRSGATNTSAGGGSTRRCTSARSTRPRCSSGSGPRTLGTLGTVPDLYLIHSLTPDSPALGDVALLDRLGALAATGVRVGISTSGPRQADALDAARELGDSPFSAVQATWNLLEPSVGPALERAHDAGWFVVVKEAVANGRLSPSSAAGESAAAALAASDGQSIDALSLRRRPGLSHGAASCSRARLRTISSTPTSHRETRRRMPRPSPGSPRAPRPTGRRATRATGPDSQGAIGLTCPCGHLHRARNTGIRFAHSASERLGPNCGAWGPPYGRSDLVMRTPDLKFTGGRFDGVVFPLDAIQQLARSPSSRMQVMARSWRTAIRGLANRSGWRTRGLRG